MRALSLVLLAATAPLVHAQALAATATTLHVGDPAPAVTVVKWLKGTPQTDFKDGKVHVVEFWATWCGPCKVGMPHLSDLAKAYGDKVAFTGVDASERTDDVAKAQAFVDQSHGMMAYNVAYATPHGPMPTDWMKAAGQNGIPCAFVVDKAGKIGWIGHPLMGLQEAVDLALAGKLDATSAKTIDAEWQARLAKGQEDYKALQETLKSGKTDEALALNERVGNEMPFQAPGLASTKYVLLKHRNAVEAQTYGESLLVEKANAPLVLRNVALTIVNDKNELSGPRDWKLAQSLLEASFDCMAPDYTSLGLLAQAKFNLGNKAEAAKLQQEALRIMPDTPTLAKVRAEGEKALAEYQGTR